MLAVGRRSAAGFAVTQGPPSSSSGIPGSDHEVIHPGLFQGAEELYTKNYKIPMKEIIDDINAGIVHAPELEESML